MGAIAKLITDFLASEQGQTLIASVLGIISVYAVRLLAALRAKNAADESKTKMNIALEKALNVVELVAPRIWRKLQPELKVALLDGRVDDVEMKRIEKIVEDELNALMTSDGIKEMAKALGYEVPGMVAWIASKVLSFMGVAHDKSDSTVPNAVATIHFPIHEAAPAEVAPAEPQVAYVPNTKFDGPEYGGG